MTEQELREKIAYYCEENDQASLLDFITQYGDTREREGTDRTLNLLEANLALCEWSDDISARKLWENMSEIHGLAELREEV